MKYNDVTQSIKENFTFLVLEVTKQVENTFKATTEAEDSLIDQIENREDYIDNLKNAIENSVLSSGSVAHTIEKRGAVDSWTILVVTNNLERIADFAVNIVGQTGYLKDPAFLGRFDYKPLFDEVASTLNLVVRAVFNSNLSLAFKICRSEVTIDLLYKRLFDGIMSDLKIRPDIEDLITSLFIFRYLERMGDSLLNIGEAIISAAAGTRFKIYQYQALSKSLGATGSKYSPLKDGFESIWGTRSGCKIGKLDKRRNEIYPEGLIFKQGNLKKLSKEKENIEQWEKIMPGLPPKVLTFQRENQSASLLMECLGGLNLQNVILGADQSILYEAISLLKETVGIIWTKTRRNRSTQARYVDQTLSRLDDIHNVHPEFNSRPVSIGSLAIQPLETLLKSLLPVDRELTAPFSTHIHGDFNTNNIIYNPQAKRIHFVDLYRSGYSDYLQDVSVFLVSNFRVPVFDSNIRKRLNMVMLDFLRFAGEFAREAQDASFEARLTLGLIRSFLTSTRFVLHKRFAQSMYQRGVYLAEKLIDHKDLPWETFVLPEEVLIY